MEHDIRLEDIGWKVLRERKVNLEKFILQAIRRVHDERGQVRLLDLALGSGRQIMEILRSLPDLQIETTLQDADPANLDAGRQLAQQLGLTTVKFALGDGFDGDALAALDPAPDVVVAAGLFELTSDNNKVLATLNGLAQGMAPDGYLIYTDQPQHPHLEMIGRVAVPREESPWAMRRRSNEEMDGLIRNAGFGVQERLVDEHGLFAVGIARR